MRNSFGCCVERSKENWAAIQNQNGDGLVAVSSALQF